MENYLVVLILSVFVLLGALYVTKVEQKIIKIKDELLKQAQIELESTKTELKSTRNELQQVKVELESTKREVKQVKVEGESTKKEVKQVQIELESTKKSVKLVKVELDKIITGASGFSASISKSKHVVIGDIIRFDKVWSDIGNNYDQLSGVYTAPRDGAYHFACTVMSHVNNAIRVNLWKNHSKTVAVYSSSYYGGTLNMVLDLKRGDRVYIKQGHVENYIYAEPDYHFSMFSGFLIQVHE